MISSRRFAGSTGAVRGGHRRFTLYAGREYGTIFIIIIIFLSIANERNTGPARFLFHQFVGFVGYIG
jgi:hypothetical protein